MVVDLHQVGFLAEDRPRYGVRLRARCREHAGKFGDHIVRSTSTCRISILPLLTPSVYFINSTGAHRLLGMQAHASCFSMAVIEVVSILSIQYPQVHHPHTHTFLSCVARILVQSPVHYTCYILLVEVLWATKNCGMKKWSTTPIPIRHEMDVAFAPKVC